MLAAQPTRGNSSRVRALNNSVLDLHGKMLKIPPGLANENTKRSIRAQANLVLKDRYASLSELIEADPNEALSLAFSEDLRAKLAAAFPDSTGLLETAGTWTGTLEYIIIDDANLNEHRAVRKLKLGTETIDLYLATDQPSRFQSGDRVSASGVRAGGKVATSSVKVSASSSPVIPTGQQNIAVLLVTFPGVTPPVSAQSVYNLFFGTTVRSLDGYWREASYGQASATGSVYGWYTLPAAYTCDQYSSLQAAAIKAADNDVYFPAYQRVFIAFPKPAGCSWGGLGTIGATTMSSADGTFTASCAWLIANYLSPNDQGAQLAAHEGGHNLGLNHSRSRDFGTDVIGKLGTLGTLTEYGDNFSAMGYYNFGHYTAQQKQQIGWIAASNIQTVQSSGSFSIAPLELNTTAVQGLRVQRGTGNNAWLLLEFRQPNGNYESTLRSQIFSGATLHYSDSNTGAYTDLLDYTPATSSWYDPALATGLSWTDPYSNVTVGIQSATSSGLVASVSYGALPCVRANPVVSLSPANPSVVAGGSVTYTIAVKNSDSAGCAATAFTLTSAQPSGWGATLSPAIVTVNPGQTVNASMMLTPPAETIPGTYPVSVTGSDSTRAATGTANCSVTLTSPPLAVTASVSGSAFPARSNVSTTAVTLSGSSAVSGASVQFTLSKPNGTSSVYTTASSNTGAATWNYKLGPKDTAGLYTVTAKATFGSELAISLPATFTVQ